MLNARAVLGIVLYFKEKVLKPLRKDEYLNRCDVPCRAEITDFVISVHFLFVDAPLWRGIIYVGRLEMYSTATPRRRSVRCDFACSLRFIHLAFFGAA